MKCKKVLTFQLVIINFAAPFEADCGLLELRLLVFFGLIECAAREPGRSPYGLHMVMQGVGGVVPPGLPPPCCCIAAVVVVSCPLGVIHASSPSCSSLRCPVKVCIEAVPLTTLTFSTHWTSRGGFPSRRGSIVTSTTAPLLVEIGCAFAPTTGRASNAIISNAGVYLGLYICSPSQTLKLLIPVPFRAAIKTTSLSTYM